VEPPNPLSDNPPDLPGYRLLRKLGEGGMGAVYQAVQIRHRRTVAVKWLAPPPDGQAPAEPLESRLLAASAHPNVVAVLDGGARAGRPFLVLEYVEGTTLRPLLRPGHPWPVGRALPVLDAVAGALAHLHARGVLHLDLKPENILCGRDGSVRVTDFGLARPVPAADAFAPLGAALGTLDYSAPEQLYGLPVGPRADLFALATLAYEMLTGRLPGRVYVPAGRHNPRLGAALDPVLQKGLARAADERQASVPEFRDAFVTAAATAEKC
jgi:eukaryotic-like serine/threonine-protein kinase